MDKNHENHNLIECHDHSWRPWYVVCVHVIGGRPVAQLKKATKDEVGECLCKACADREEPPPVEQLKACCDRCTEEKIIPAAGMLH